MQKSNQMNMKKPGKQSKRQMGSSCLEVSDNEEFWGKWQLRNMPELIKFHFWAFVMDFNLLP